jgi:hypothetical protein
MPRLLSFSLLVTPAIGKEVRYLFASRKALLSFASKMMRERFVGSRVPFIWDNGEWTLDLETVSEFEKPVNIKAVFSQVATLFATFADMGTLPTDAKDELRDAVQHAFDLSDIEWFLPIGENPPESRNDYWQERRNIERDLPEDYSHSTFQGIPLTNKPPGT